MKFLKFNRRGVKWLIVIGTPLIVASAVLAGIVVYGWGSDAALSEADKAALAGLPLIFVPPQPNADAHTLAIIVPGDGGWATLARHVAGRLADKGVAVVGLNSMRYFHHRRTPEEFTADLQRIMDRFSAERRIDRILLIGYSRGAGVLPFAVNRLPSETLSRVGLVVLLGLTPSISFKIHWRDYLGHLFEVDDLPTVPEVKAIHGTRVLLICGDEEKLSPCATLDGGQIETAMVPGAHHFNGDYSRVADIILERAQLIP